MPTIIYRLCKRGFFTVCKGLGFFALARRASGDGLRILAYHGFAIRDEERFLPRTFMRPDTFAKRLAFLAAHRYPVMPLESALAALDSRTLPNGAVAITIDDGFYSTYAYAVPLLAAHRFPATVYVTTYYSIIGSPVFDLIVSYLLWKSGEETFDGTVLGIGCEGAIRLQNRAARRDTAARIIAYGNRCLDNAGRIELARKLSFALRIDYESISRERLFSIVNTTEIKAMADLGFDIQLHTHRHRLRLARDEVLREIADNRAALANAVEGQRTHLCYPMGYYSPHQWPWLAEAGVESATTCEPGLNYRGEPLLGLKRFLDGEDISAIEFEAELSGFAELLRGIRRKLRGRPAHAPVDS